MQHFEISSCKGWKVMQEKDNFTLDNYPDFASHGKLYITWLWL